MIVKLSSRTGTEIGPLPRKVGLERLRWTGSELVDLADLPSMWVRKKGGSFELHALRVPGSQRVTMTYNQRKRLTDDNGLYRILAQVEIDTAKAKRDSEALETRNLKQKIISLAQNMTYADVTTFVETNFANHTAAQRNLLKNISYVALHVAKKEARRMGGA